MNDQQTETKQPIATSDLTVRIQASMLRRRLAAKHPQGGTVLRITGLLGDAELIERWQEHEADNRDHHLLMEMVRLKQAAGKQESQFDKLARKATQS